MNEQEIAKLKAIIKNKKVVYRSDENEFLRVFTITPRADEYGDCANLSSGCYVFLPDAEPEWFFLLEGLAAQISGSEDQ